MNYEYGNWIFALLNIGIFLYFIQTAFKPKTKTDWKTYGSLGAFIIALFAEMYGFPLTIYLLTSYFGSNFLGMDFSHNNGHLLNTILGLKGDPHFSIIHILSAVLIVGGLFLLSSAWNILYKSSKKGILAVTGVYQYLRHPQYWAFVLIIIGFLLQWPTLITLIMAPILILRYILLARSEEKEMIKKYGQEYITYKSRVPIFLSKKYSTFITGFVFGSFGLTAFYYIILFIVTGDPIHPFNQFKLFQPWMSLLIIGFGIQFGLFWLLRKGYQFVAGSSGAVSGLAMVACCAHHVLDVLPILGFSAAAIFLSQYQEQFLIFGVIVNIIGILIMLWFLKSKTK